MSRKRVKKQIDLEESLGEEWSKDLEIVEVPLGNEPLIYLGVAIFAVSIIFAARIFYFNFYNGALYASRAEINATKYERTVAPRGLIFDRNGQILAENKGTFRAILDAKEFLGRPSIAGRASPEAGRSSVGERPLRSGEDETRVSLASLQLWRSGPEAGRDDLQEKTLTELENVLYLPRDYVWNLIQENSADDFTTPIVLSDNLTQEQLVVLKSSDLPTVVVESGFKRVYPRGQTFSSVVGYTGRVDIDDLKNDHDLYPADSLGRDGIEAFYDKELRGEPGVLARFKNAQGKVLSEEKKNEPKIGTSLRLTIDGGLQEYFYSRLKGGLNALGRRVGIGIAINPQNGEVLALVNLPGFDNNLFAGPGRNEEKLALLNSKDKPLFNRAVGGFYTPGSTIKPLVGVATLKEGIIDPKRQIFSPGYLDVPNPYDPENPTRFLDWRYQGNVDLAAAIAQSSNVYFYTVGGGARTQILNKGAPADTGYVAGLGISRLREWWQKFNLGKLTGIDLPGEGEGFLPSPEWKEKKTSRPWFLGDTYHVSIGQGDLLLTPIQLLNYISALATAGKIYQPVVNLDQSHQKLLTDLSEFGPEIREVQKGMRETVTSPLGTAYLLHDLGFSVGAKTGSSQVENNAQENAIFVGYAPTENPQIAVLVLIEHSLEGSLNAVPIAKDVLNWYYWNRVKK